METWRKSSHSQTSGATNCVEAANLPHGIALRDSKNSTSGHLSITATGFRRLLQQLKNDENIPSSEARWLRWPIPRSGERSSLCS
ncbi:DUF397 domain-containing protein [Thermomonospora umbrina]|uniref:Uncharacterized protein DUF397 n=1 Tax=Thermomonospora umbrina TaxID=111806 RepID=A0A3D9SNY5_9ACTN|nr:uncharacterized protein DUF397 [Thermomonospora umbrina]